VSKKKQPSKKPRGPKERSQPRTSEGVRNLAAELREVADRLEGYADSMQSLGIRSIKPLTGNFHQALEKIRVFTTQQVLARLMVEAEKLGKKAHDVLAP
jgi:hypothetical protein